MNTIEFLTAIWPTTGPFYGIAWIENGGWKHKAFETGEIAQAQVFAAVKSRNFDVYLVLHSVRELVEHTLGDGRTYMRLKREGQYMRACRVHYCDLDIFDPAKDKPEDRARKYDTQAEAFADLKRVLKETGLPQPLVINSGRGLHVYWLLENELDSQTTWLAQATLLKRVLINRGLRIDPSATADRARVLRVVGTWHRKDPTNPLKVKLYAPAPDGRIQNAVFDAVMVAEEKLLPTIEATYERLEYAETEKPSPRAVLAICPTTVAMVNESMTSSARGVVWRDLNAIALHTTGGKAFAHAMSKSYNKGPDERYSFEATEEKLDRIIEQKIGPTSCGKLNELFKPSHCLACKFNPGAENPGTSPVAIARRQPKTAVPIGTPELGRDDPFMRTKRGVEWKAPEVDGKQPPPQVILPYDFYPLSLLDEAATNTKAVIWVVEVPNKGRLEIKIPAAAYGDPKELRQILANHGVIPESRHLKKLGDYMSHYIRMLQKQQAERKQYESFGWNPAHNEFVTGNQVFTSTGVETANFASGMVNLISAMKPRGTLEGQVNLLKFYNDPAYIRQQFLIGASLGAVLMFMTQHYGLIISLSGDSGSAKSSALYAAAGMWAVPEQYVIDGGDDGATALGRANRVRMLANLPVCVDEITLMLPEQLRRMVMSITQPGGRVAIGKDGQEREMPETSKATVCLCTSNASAHDQLSQNNLAGSAGSQRLLEIHCPSHPGVHTKTQADEFLLGLREHCGHIGPEVVKYVLRNMEAVRAELKELSALVDRLGAIKPKDRYWSTAVVVTVMGLRIAKRLGLLAYDPQHALAWGLQQIAIQREVVVETYVDPVEILQAYMQSIVTNMLVITPPTGMATGMWNIARVPVGPFKGRLEPDNLAFISLSFFKEYCDWRKIPYERTVKALTDAKVAVRKKVKMGAHASGYEVGGVWCLRIDVRHEALSGQAPLEGDGKVIQAFPGGKGVAST